MRTTSQLLLVVLGVTLVAQIIYGTVAYWMISGSERQNLFTQVANDAYRIAAEIDGVSIDQLANEEIAFPLLRNLGLTGSVSLFDAGDNSDVVRFGSRFVDVESQLLNTDQIRTPYQQGEVCTDRCYAWATVPAVDKQHTLLLITPEKDNVVSLGETLSMRLVSSGVIVLWIAVWAALVLSSTITKKLNAKNKALVYQALHDELTGLPNRNYLFDKMEEALSEAEEASESFSILLMDLDRFKEVNDTLGHHFGDHLLVEVANRLHHKMKKPVTVARLGGDEFAVLVPGANHKKAIEVAKTITLSMLEPVPVDGIELEISMSIGIATYPADGNEAEELLQHADVAMYRAKRSMAKYMVYESNEDGNSIRRLRIMGELRNVIENDELDVHYQPKVCLKTDRVIGMEALVRWHHPELGFVPPDEFIPLAEQTGLIHPLTDWVMQQAMKFCAQLRAEGYELTVAVNLSTFALQDAGFADELALRIVQSDLPANRLELEITESAMMTDLPTASKVLDRIVNQDVQLAIDDFGTGFSSLAYLKKLPVSQLKIDKSFVLDMVSDTNDRAIVKSIIDLAHHMDKVVVAEGVENQECLDFLRSQHCDIAQGYFISRPLPGDGLRQWLRDSPWGKAARTRDVNVIDFISGRKLHSS